ncbi:MAG: hypothetical protein MI974_08810 [Chitinophagales bacterium]|nr:hypothetical protein [Chitinophagales bacterium]
MENNNIILHAITPAELKKMLREMIQEEFQQVNNEIQRVIGEDDLVSTGTAARLLGGGLKCYGIWSMKDILPYSII